MKRILGIGGVTTDQIGVVDHIPGSDEVIRLQEYRVEQGGMVATALVAAARLGAEVEFLGAVGDDANGRLALDRFAVERVATTGAGDGFHGGQSGLPSFKQVQGFLSERGILLP